MVSGLNNPPSSIGVLHSLVNEWPNVLWVEQTAIFYRCVALYFSLRVDSVKFSFGHRSLPGRSLWGGVGSYSSYPPPLTVLSRCYHLYVPGHRCDDASMECKIEMRRSRHYHHGPAPAGVWLKRCSSKAHNHNMFT